MKNLVTRTVLCVAMFAGPLLAQSTQPQPQPQPKTAEEEKKAKVTEEVTVTARKTEEKVEDVPISVAAPTESELRDRGATTLEDVAANVAGFTVQNLGPAQSQVAVRGVSSGQIVRDQPGVKEQVGVYLDESVISLSLFTPDIDLFDLSRVEVLRGPQGTLFGSGSESGTVRYITNAPQVNSNETVGEASVESITNGSVGGSVKAAVNFPMGTTNAGRVVGYYTKYGGYIDAVQPDLSVKNNYNDGYRAGTRLAFLFQPTTQLSVTPRIIYQKVDMNGWNRIDVFNILANPYTTTRPKVQLGDHQTFTQIGEPTTDKFFLGDVNLNYKLGGGMALTSITSYTDRNVLVVRDAGALTSSITGGSVGLPENIYTLDAPLNDSTKAKVFTEELRLAGSSGASNKFDWVGGVFFDHTKRHYAQNLPVTGFTAASGIPTAGVYNPTDSLFWSDLNYNFHQYALFGEANYRVNPALELSGGLRFYNYKEDRDQIFDGIFGQDANGNPQIQPGSAKANGVAPRVMANWKITDDNRLYGQIAKGFRLGGINDPLNVNLCTPADRATFGGHDSWDDETLWNYEIGSKNRVMGGKGSVNVAAFYADIKNLQATVTAGSCSSRLVFNVPKAHSAGAEIELDMNPNPIFDFALSASHTDSKLDSTVTSTDTAGNVAIISGIRDGARMPTVPENQASAAATFHWTASNNWAGYVTGVYQYIGDRYTQVGDDSLFCVPSGATTCPNATLDINSFGHSIGGPFTQNTFTFDPKLPAYNVVNLRFGVLRGRWDTALYVNNVTDETAYLSLDRERGFRARVAFLTNQPRTFGISTRATF